MTVKVKVDVFLGFTWKHTHTHRCPRAKASVATPDQTQECSFFSARARAYSKFAKINRFLLQNLLMLKPPFIKIKAFSAVC